MKNVAKKKILQCKLKIIGKNLNAYYFYYNWKKKKKSQLIITLAVDESKGHEFEFIIKKKEISVWISSVQNIS